MLRFTEIVLKWTLLFLFVVTHYCYGDTGSEIITLDRNYVIVADKTTPVKGEFALRHQLFKDLPLYIAYHHKIVWDLNGFSAPVIDSNYNPHMFYYIGSKYKWKWNLGILEHLSNGQKDEESRSRNMSYLHFIREYQLEGMKIEIAGKLFLSYTRDESSPDLVEYMGVWAALIRFHNFLSFITKEHIFEVRVSPGGRWGTRFQNGNFEIGLKFRPTLNSNFYIYLQHFNGRNEYLLNYKKYKNVTRIGVELDI